MLFADGSADNIFFRLEDYPSGLSNHLFYTAHRPIELLHVVFHALDKFVMVFQLQRFPTDSEAVLHKYSIILLLKLIITLTFTQSIKSI